MLFAASLVSITTNAQSKTGSKTFAERKAKVIEILKQNVANGLPGAAIAYYSKENSVWVHSEGCSDMENNENLKDSDLHYLQSVSKLYMAVTILKLSEEGKINLDATIGSYLDKKTLGELQTKGITVKMLLNHTSGIREYANNPEFVKFVLENATTPFHAQRCVDIVKDEPLDFKPGSDYSYSNTNYTILSLIADKITGNHVKYMEKNIFKKLDLQNTIYLTKSNYSSVPGIVNSYWDVLNVEKPVNITKLQKVNVASLRGDDGIVCTTTDAIKFMKGLVEGKILKPETLAMMQHWVTKDGQKRYGLGLTYYDLGGTYGIGHSGGGIGAGCVLIYLPEFDTYVFLATNFNTLVDSKISQKCSKIQYDILSALFL